MFFISVIVPVYNRQDVIEKCLRGIRESSYKDYELIVVDCASTDKTFLISKIYADIVIESFHNPERTQARRRGAEASKGQVIVNIDSDVVIKPNTLAIIGDYFLQHQDVDALTGCLSKENPWPDFFSQYKNLYMYYNFKRLPENITFLYGSIYAVKRDAWEGPEFDIKIADDTALGQRLVSEGRKVVFLKELEVVHLKKHNFISFIKNDFLIPFDWAKIFIRYKGWKELGRNNLGFAHASKVQLLSVILAPAVFILLVIGGFNHFYFLPALLLSFVWSFLNVRFIKFLTQERGLVFGCQAFFITFLDNIIMFSGIVWGMLNYVFK